MYNIPVYMVLCKKFGIQYCFVKFSLDYSSNRKIQPTIN